MTALRVLRPYFFLQKMGSQKKDMGSSHFLAVRFLSAHNTWIPNQPHSGRLHKATVRPQRRGERLGTLNFNETEK